MTHPLSAEAYEAEVVLRQLAFGPGTPAQRMARIRPTEADYLALFGDRAAEVAEAYERLWDDPVLPGGKPGQTRILLTAATAGDIASDPAQARRFPGGFSKVAASLPSDSVWVTWKLTRPDSLSGMAYDGLVRCDPGRWAWFPKLWRALAPR